MFKTRLLSGILLVLIALVTMIVGGDVLFFTILAISLIGMTEIYKILSVEKKTLGIAGYLAAIAYFALLRFGMGEWIVCLLVGFLILLLAIYVFAYPKYRSEQVMLTFFGLFYVAFMLSYVYQIRLLEQGAFLVWLIFLCSWGCDTSAYCVGMLIGKHKLAPVLSPKKSIEGAVGGVVGAALLGVLYALALNRFASDVNANVLYYALICAAGAVISQVGDLAASAIKRNHDIKDYGKLIPGHGGILDRFDSVIITAPIIYYMVTILM
ncbi:MAG: phosphatidate cytidylyltransferase [Faecalimonas sp.]|nr:phosphatidate cytidylyltransferase [Faecalimonas sp.]